jgi:hypothetical protein
VHSSLEDTKATVGEISAKKEIAITTTKMVEEAREAYRPIATRGSLIYFLIDQLSVPPQPSAPRIRASPTSSERLTLSCRCGRVLLLR